MSVQNIKSRERVRNHGEVFTAGREVKAMCDLVGEDIADIEKSVLEPAAGNGNFLVEILQRRIDKIAQTPAKNGNKNFLLLVALSNIYAVDILADNVKEARQRLKEIMLNAVSRPGADYESAVDALLETNIIRGDFLTKSKRAVPIFEYVPNYEKRTFDITKHTLYEIKRTARKSRTGIKPAGIGKCIEELKYRRLKAAKIKPSPKPPVNPLLFPTENPDLFSRQENINHTMEKLKPTAEK
ncbi:MAG: hypothetical protein LBT46_09840 [Planctomycetaceae bacterium]|jgi:hypothetical protein|nr:hypothetical protein [Planctomycetaceae bacterium]